MNNGGCSQMCVMDTAPPPMNYHCNCSLGFILASNMKTCLGEHGK